MTPRIYVNGRFLTQPVTGVQRYAREVLAAADRLLAQAGGERPRIELLVPPGTVSDFVLPGMPRREVGSRHGHAWEQLDLARHARDGLLISLCNTGPLLHPRHIVCIHDLGVFVTPAAYTLAFRSWYRLLFRVFASRAEHVMTVSAFSAGELRERLGVPAERLHWAPNGGDHMDSVKADASVLERHGLERGRFMLGVGSASPNKNFRCLAEAQAMVAGDGLITAVVGAANPRVFGQALCEAPGLRWLGRLEDVELKALYAAAAGFVFPSRYEGFGLPPLEAMWCGAPVIAARASAVPEVCGDAALYFDPEDPAALAAQMRRLMADEPLRRVLASRGRERARGFRWSAVASLLLQLAGLAPSGRGMEERADAGLGDVREY